MKLQLETYRCFFLSMELEQNVQKVPKETFESSLT